MFRCRTLQIQILNENNEMNAIDDDLDSDTDCRELHCYGCFDIGLRIHLLAHRTLPLECLQFALGNTILITTSRSRIRECWLVDFLNKSVLFSNR